MILRIQGLIRCSSFLQNWAVFYLASESNRGLFEECPKQTPDILSLAQLLKRRCEQDPAVLIESNPQECFEYGIDPYHFRHQLYVYYKYAHWLNNPIATGRLQDLIHKYTQLEQQSEGKQDQPANSNKQLIHQYRRQISTELMPTDISLYDMSQQLVQQLYIYLHASSTLTLRESHYILVNFEHLMFRSTDRQFFSNHRDNAYQLKSAFDRYLHLSLPWIEELPKTHKPKCISLAKSLRVFNLPFMEYIKRDLQKQKKDISLEDHLSALVYLGLGESFPYEYFYSQKGSLMNYIEAAEAFSDKKLAACINFLQIFSRVRLMYCEKIIDRLLACIEENIPATEITQIARIFKHYSYIQYGIKEEFVMKLVERTELFSQQMDQVHYSMIVLAVARINYRNPEFVDRLKLYNYELFLAELKFGCEKLGDYYQAILQQVEEADRARNQGLYSQSAGNNPDTAIPFETQ